MLQIHFSPADPTQPTYSMTTRIFPLPAKLGASLAVADEVFASAISGVHAA
jgi:hypothetical protein